MLLRRVIDHVREQEWTEIWIDLVIVVVGVFIGIQVSNWNDDRALARRAAVFSERLRSDLREEAWGYEMQVGYYTDVAAHGRRALDALAGRAPLPDEQLLIAAYRATQFNGPGLAISAVVPAESAARRAAGPDHRLRRSRRARASWPLVVSARLATDTLKLPPVVATSRVGLIAAQAQPNGPALGS